MDTWHPVLVGALFFALGAFISAGIASNPQIRSPSCVFVVLTPTLILMVFILGRQGAIQDVYAALDGLQKAALTLLARWCIAIVAFWLGLKAGDLMANASRRN